MGLETIQNITLDLTVPRIKNVRCVQDDRNTRIINIVVTNDGKPYPITNEMIVSYKVFKADSNYVWNKKDVIINDDGSVTIDLSDQAVAFVGIAKSSLKIQESEQKISTLPFNIIVEKAVVSDDAISSSIESDIIDDFESHLVDTNNPHKIPNATTTGVKGLTELEDSVTSTSTTTAATPNSVKTVNDTLTNEIERAKESEKTIADNLSEEVIRATESESALDSAKADKTSVYTKNEVDNKFSSLETNIDWKESVDTYDDISTTYPEPVDGWTVNVKDKDYTYRYNGTEWVAISANAIPKVTENVDGLLSKEDYIKYEDANSKKHTHENKSIIDNITQTLIDAWNAAYTHISDTIKHITSSERTNWNTAYTHSQSTHAPIDAEANQNAFSNVVVGSTTIQADTTTDTLTFKAGSNVTIEPNADTNEITISSSHPSVSKNTDSTSTASPSAGGTFTAVDSITRDSYGHVKKINTKTVTLPNTDVVVDSALSSSSTNPVQNKAIAAELTNYAKTTFVSSGDFNDIVTPGFYTMKYAIANNPVSSEKYYGLVVLKSDSGNYVEQIAFKESSNKLYVRHLSGSTWSDWKKVLTEENISQSNAVTATGTYALDAVEKNASVEGTLANQIAELNTNFTPFFSDYTRKIADVSEESYTATENCLVICDLITSGAPYEIMRISINDIQFYIYQNTTSQANVQNRTSYLLKAGDVIKIIASVYAMHVYGRI